MSILTFLLVLPLLLVPAAAAEGACAGPILSAVRVVRHCFDAEADASPSAAFCVGGGGDPYTPTPSCDRVSVGGEREVDVDAASGYWSTKRTLVVDVDSDGGAHVESVGDIPGVLLIVYPGLRGERDVAATAADGSASFSTRGYNANAPFDLHAVAGPEGVDYGSYGCFKGYILGVPYGLECGDWTHDPRLAR